jgi:hypothetical protein
MSTGGMFEIPLALRPALPDIEKDKLWPSIRTDSCAAAAFLLMEASMRNNNRVPDGWAAGDIMHLAGRPEVRGPFLFLAACIISTKKRREFTADQMRQMFEIAQTAQATSGSLFEQTLIACHRAFFVYKWLRSKIAVRVDHADEGFDVRQLWERLVAKGDSPDWRAMRLYLVGNILRAQTSKQKNKLVMSTAVRGDGMVLDGFAPFVLLEFASGPGAFAPSYAFVALMDFFRTAGVPDGLLDSVTNLALEGLTLRVPCHKCLSQNLVLYSALRLADALVDVHGDEIRDRRRAEMHALAGMACYLAFDRPIICDLAVSLCKKIPSAANWEDVIEVGPEMERRPYAIRNDGRMHAEPEEFAYLMKLRGRTHTSTVNLYRIFDETWNFDMKMWPLNAFLDEIPSNNVPKILNLLVF